MNYNDMCPKCFHKSGGRFLSAKNRRTPKEDEAMIDAIAKSRALEIDKHSIDDICLANGVFDFTFRCHCKVCDFKFEYTANTWMYYG